MRCGVITHKKIEMYFRRHTVSAVPHNTDETIMTTNTMTINLDDANLVQTLKTLIAEAGIPVDAIYEDDEILGCECVAIAVSQEREDCEQETVEKYEEEIEELKQELADHKEQDEQDWRDKQDEYEEEIRDLEKKVAELTEQMRFLDPNGKPCDRCNEPVCYEGNEGKVSRQDEAIICAECDAREADEAKYTTCESCRRNCYTGGTEYPDGYTCEDCEEDEEASDADTEDDE